MKVLIDVGVGRSVEEFLKAAGHKVLSVRELDPRMRDADILDLAAREGCLVITMDKDFGELVFRTGRKHAGVLLLRLEDARGREKVEVVKEIFACYGEELLGSFSVYQSGKLRIRPS